ncbi:MAG: GFA family protein [Rhodobacteraceae bacterium]|nr:GFA family protein [Paracoccaceae bacterium]
MSEIHEGGCVCGAVRFETRAAPQRVSACSCGWCTKRTGAPLGVSVYFLKEDVRFTQGALTPFRLTSDAGRWIESEFCGTCGTTVSWTLEFLPDFRGIAAGTFDTPSFWYRPQRYVFTRSKPDWLHLDGDVPCFAAMPGS